MLTDHRSDVEEGTVTRRKTEPKTELSFKESEKRAISQEPANSRPKRRRTGPTSYNVSESFPDELDDLDDLDDFEDEVEDEDDGAANSVAMPLMNEEDGWADEDEEPDDDVATKDEEAPLPTKKRSDRFKHTRYGADLTDKEWGSLHEAWLARWSMKKVSHTYSPQKIKENKKRLRDRLKLIIQKKIDAAKKISWEDFSEHRCGMWRSWWQLLTRLDAELAVGKILANTAEIVQVVLGESGPLTPNVFRQLPDDWKLNRLLSDYVDFVTYDDQVWFDPYAGSARGKKGGTHGRLTVYDRINRTKNRGSNESSRHERSLSRSDAHTNLRLLTVWDPSKDNGPYISLGEQIWNSFFGCLNGSKPGHDHYSPAAKVIIDDCLPAEFKPLPYKGLNDAAQMEQGLGRIKANQKCSNCSRTESKAGWYSAQKGLPWSELWCDACYQYARKHNGEVRPKHLHNKKKTVINKTPLPANGKCTVCHKPPRETPRGRKWANSPVTGEWACIKCAERIRRRMAEGQTAKQAMGPW